MKAVFLCSLLLAGIRLALAAADSVFLGRAAQALRSGLYGSSLARPVSLLKFLVILNTLPPRRRPPDRIQFFSKPGPALLPPLFLRRQACFPCSRGSRRHIRNTAPDDSKGKRKTPHSSQNLGLPLDISNSINKTRLGNFSKMLHKHH